MPRNAPPKKPNVAPIAPLPAGNKRPSAIQPPNQHSSQMTTPAPRSLVIATTYSSRNSHRGEYSRESCAAGRNGIPIGHGHLQKGPGGVHRAPPAGAAQPATDRAGLGASNQA